MQAARTLTAPTRRKPGVEPIRSYINGLPGKAFEDGNCAPNTYYLVNNYKLGFNYKGDPNPLGSDNSPAAAEYPHYRGRALRAWRLMEVVYSGGRQTGDTAPSNEYCGICDR